MIARSVEKIPLPHFVSWTNLRFLWSRPLPDDATATWVELERASEIVATQRIMAAFAQLARRA